MANYQYQKVVSEGIPKTKGQCKRNFQMAMNEILNVECDTDGKSKKKKDFSVNVLIKEDKKGSSSKKNKYAFVTKQIFLTNNHYRQIDILEML